MSSPFDEDQVAAFWEQARQAAEDADESGYLTDEWPRAMALNRFRGEFRDVERWLTRGLQRRGACLDVGCGTGLWLERLSPMFERADGFDISHAMVESARARLAEQKAVSVRQGSLLELDAEQAYDFIFVGGVLMYLRDEVLADGVANIRRALSKGGLVIFRESCNRTGTRYRDTPLQPGLFADPDAPRAPYYAVYREPRELRQKLHEHGFQVERMAFNKHYKLSDITEGWMWFLDRLHGGSLRRERARAERWAQRVHRLRWLTLFPYYYVVRGLRIPVWNLQNYWYLCRRRE